MGTSRRVPVFERWCQNFRNIRVRVLPRDSERFEILAYSHSSGYIKSETATTRERVSCVLFEYF